MRRVKRIAILMSGLLCLILAGSLRAQDVEPADTTAPDTTAPDATAPDADQRALTGSYIKLYEEYLELKKAGQMEAAQAKYDEFLAAYQGALALRPDSDEPTTGASAPPDDAEPEEEPAEDATGDATPGSKVGICHRTRSARHPFIFIRVSENAIPAHLAHGDRLSSGPGECRGSRHAPDTPGASPAPPEHEPREPREPRDRGGKPADPDGPTQEPREREPREPREREPRETGKPRDPDDPAPATDAEGAVETP